MMRGNDHLVGGRLLQECFTTGGMNKILAPGRTPILN